MQTAGDIPKPALCTSVFLQALKQLGVDVEMSEHEADDRLMELVSVTHASEIHTPHCTLLCRGRRTALKGEPLTGDGFQNGRNNDSLLPHER